MKLLGSKGWVLWSLCARLWLWRLRIYRFFSNLALSKAGLGLLGLWILRRRLLLLGWGWRVSRDVFSWFLGILICGRIVLCIFGLFGTGFLRRLGVGIGERCGCRYGWDRRGLGRIGLVGLLVGIWGLLAGMIHIWEPFLALRSCFLDLRWFLCGLLCSCLWLFCWIFDLMLIVPRRNPFGFRSYRYIPLHFLNSYIFPFHSY